MKVKDIKNAYTAYLLDVESRVMLSQQFPPKYPKFIGHHVTVQFGVPASTIPPAPASVSVVGYADSEDGLEALVVSVNGSAKRDDGSTYHITWSLDPAKYSPKHSNDLLKKGFTEVDPVAVRTTPATLQ